MKNKRATWMLRMLLLLVVAPLARVATGAQYPAWQGKFTLPFEVRWGNDVLPPGDYQFRFNDSAFSTAPRSITVYGKNKTVTLFAYRAYECHSEHNALIVTQAGTRRVYVLHLGNDVYYYGTPQVEGQLIAAGVSPSGCCHTVCCAVRQQGGHVHHAEVLQSIPVSAGGM
jgi:hypothetical protein